MPWENGRLLVPPNTRRSSTAVFANQSRSAAVHAHELRGRASINRAGEPHFLESDDADHVMSEGIIVPILAIDDGDYDVVLRSAKEPSCVERWVLAENRTYAFRARKTTVIADVGLLERWRGFDGHFGPHAVRVEIDSGDYAVGVRGFRREQDRYVDLAGYEFVLSARSQLPMVTADTGAKMRVLYPTGEKRRTPSGHRGRR